MEHISFGAPKGVCFDQGGCFEKIISWFSWFLEILQLNVFNRGLFSDSHLVVLVVSSVKNEPPPS